MAEARFERLARFVVPYLYSFDVWAETTSAVVLGVFNASHIVTNLAYFVFKVLSPGDQHEFVHKCYCP